MSPQDPPFAIQIEPTEGCTLACGFCGLQAIRDNGAEAEDMMGNMVHGNGKGPYKFMTLFTASRIAAEIHTLKWNPRIEFAMHGEPTMNKDLPEMIHMFRQALPKVSIMVTSNGSGCTTPDRVEALFNAGLNTLAIDNYVHADFVQRMRRNQCFHSSFLIPVGISVHHYPKDKTASPHTRFYGKRIVVIKDISELKTGNHQLTNQGGNSLRPLDEPLVRRCAKPFRELSIRWDGSVAVCCDDWKGEYKIGNVCDGQLVDLWNHPRFQAARVALYHKQRGAIKVCSGCNVQTYRDGLLPDKMGKEDMRKLNAADLANIREAQRDKVFSIKLV